MSGEAGEGAAAEGARCGFVAIIGAPNAGKSTLLNALVGAKVAIVSPRVQTTRTRILGIATRGASQIVFVDTPGIFQPRRRLDRAMVAAAWRGAEDADHIVLLADAARRGAPDAETLAIIDRLNASGRTAILALNKVDAMARDRLLPLSAALNAKGRFSRTFMISALSGDGLDALLDHLAAIVPEGPWLYPEDQLTDMPMRLAAAEATREQIYHRLWQELPYAATVETESWEEQPDGTVRIRQVIFVERESQKGIVLGKGGQMIRAIGTGARAEIEEMLGQHVFLDLFVKVRGSWGEDPERYRDWGLDYDV